MFKKESKKELSGEVLRDSENNIVLKLDDSGDNVYYLRFPEGKFTFKEYVAKDLYDFFKKIMDE